MLLAMEFTYADPTSTALFFLFAVAMFFLVHLTLIFKQPQKLWVFVNIILVFSFALLAFFGITRANILPLAPILMASLFIVGILFSFSTGGKQLALKTPLYILIGFQAFRFPLEILLHLWSDQGTIPETMTWTGSNFDILAGLLSLGSFYFVKNNKKLGYFVNAIGFVLLMNVLRVVIMSSPFPFSWPLDQPLQLIFYFPYALIAPSFVLPAFVGHLLVFQRMRLAY